MIKLCLPQISRHHTGSFPPGLDALPAVRELLPVLALPHPLLHPLPGGGDLLLVLVRLHQLRLPGLRRVWGWGGSRSRSRVQVPTIENRFSLFLVTVITLQSFYFIWRNAFQGTFFDLSFLINYVIHTNYAKTSTFPHYPRLAKSVSSWPCSTAWWWCPSCCSTVTWSCKERRSQSQG